MAFYKRVNLVGPKGEKLQGWVAEKHADTGNIVRLVEDEKTRPFRIEESGEQLLLESQIDPRHLLTPIVDATDDVRPRHFEGNGADVPESILRKPRKPRAVKSVDVQ